MHGYKRLVEFRVSGVGYFPVDMLRYDRCWPATTDDAVSVGANPKDWPGEREVLNPFACYAMLAAVLTDLQRDHIILQ